MLKIKGFTPPSTIFPSIRWRQPIGPPYISSPSNARMVRPSSSWPSFRGVIIVFPKTPDDSRSVFSRCSAMLMELEKMSANVDKI